jgi:hypothetical protein
MELLENDNSDNFQVHTKQNPIPSVEGRRLKELVEYFEDGCS